MILTGNCHCRAVRLTVTETPHHLTQCTCSICHRYGAQWIYGTADTIRVECEPGAVNAYMWGDHTIEFNHCRDCGCVTHYESARKEPGSRIAVNARMFPVKDLEGIPLRTFDGADTWKLLD